MVQKRSFEDMNSNVRRKDINKVIDEPRAAFRRKRASIRWRVVRRSWRWLPGGFLKDFCRQTNMHGFGHIVTERRHLFEKLLWLCVTSLAVVGAIQLSIDQWNRFVASPTVTALEKDFRMWNFTFPAITTCILDRVDPKQLPALILSIWNVTKIAQPERYQYLSRFVEVVANAKFANLSGFEEFHDDSSLNVNLTQIVVNVIPMYKGSTVWFDRNIANSWINTMTELGICHTINSLAAVDNRIHINGAPEYPNAVEPISCLFNLHLCYVRIELLHACATVMLVEVRRTTANCTVAALYYIHSPFDIADKSQEGVILCRGKDVTMNFKVVETKSASDIRNLNFEQRQCLFNDEPQKPGRKTYGDDTCRVSCRNKMALKLCGCKPFFNIREEGPTCNISGLVCLWRNVELILKADSSDLRCVCPLQCIDAKYELVDTTGLVWGGPFATRSSLKIGILPPKSRYKREILFSFEDLVVSFGGAAGLFLGCSFLSFVEIVYFIVAKATSALETRWRGRTRVSSKADGSTRENFADTSEGMQNVYLGQVDPKMQFIKRVARMNHFSHPTGLQSGMYT